MAGNDSNSGRFEDQVEFGRSESGGLDPERHADILREVGMIRPESASATARPPEVKNAFWQGEAGRFSAADLASAGIINASRSEDAGQSRPQSETAGFVLRKTEDGASGESKAHFRVNTDGTIDQLRNPDKVLSATDGKVIMEISGDPASMSEREKAAARQMLEYVNDRYHPNPHDALLDPKVFFALYVDTEVPTPAKLAYTEGYNGHRLREDEEELVINPDGSYSPRRVGRSRRNAGREQQVFREIGPRGDIRDVAGMGNFLDRVVAAVSGNEGGFTSINWNDNGAGISVGKAQWNQRSGELPTLLKEWHERNPALFAQVFGNDAQNMLSERFVRGANITQGSDLGRKMAAALSQPEFQDVQTELLREKAIRALELASKYGHTSELFVAQVADMANQFGWGGVESCMKRANVANIDDERSAVRSLRSVGQSKWSGRTSRDTKLASLFSVDRQAMG